MERQILIFGIIRKLPPDHRNHSTIWTLSNFRGGAIAKLWQIGAAIAPPTAYLGLAEKGDFDSIFPKMLELQCVNKWDYFYLHPLLC